MGQTPSSRLPSSSSSGGDDAGVDYTAALPDDILAVVFSSLPHSVRNSCSLVCRRWLAVDSRSRRRLSLHARATLLAAAPSLFHRFPAVSTLSLTSHRRTSADSIGDDALAAVALGCPNLTRIKLRGLHSITASGMAALGAACPKIRKLSVSSCAFGSKGVSAIINGYANLEELSIKRLRGLSEPITISTSSSLRSICLKELYNGQCFAPLLTSSSNLRVLKLFRCSGDWDPLLEEIAVKISGIIEIHLEKLQVSDRGLAALASCSYLEVLRLIKTPECTDAGLTALAGSCRLLRKIHIDGWKTNRIGDLGLIAIANKCLNLQELVLIGVNPTAVSLKLIATNCSNLERLALCGSETFGDAEISCIASKCSALRKLCIKGCPVSDHGMESLAIGCPKLVKVKVKKCRGVTTEFAEWLRASRGSVIVNFDTIRGNEVQDLSVSESGILENGGDEVVLVDHDRVVELPSGSNGRPSLWKARMSVVVGRHFIASAFRGWSLGSICPRNT
ncbi:F-box protein At1g47056-like [Typha angustifolia]|uniref:F-box protein At1g47056-like n=1 Tax=Typha angustifolia TaxID=59011 RepID=UPI003C2F099A